MSAPPQLDQISNALADLDRIKVVGEWTRYGRSWVLPVLAKLAAPPSAWMPESSRWFLEVAAVEGSDAIDLNVFPAVDGGISATFPHQDLNSPIPKRPWRSGKPCLERRTATFNRQGWLDEPTELEARAQWKIHRLLAWMDLAAQDQLLQVGDPLELPVGAASNARSAIGFIEDEHGATWWLSRSQTWGFAHVSALAGSATVGFLHRFMDPELGEVRTIAPAPRLRRDHGTPNAIWIRLPALPIIPPWQLPHSWCELQQIVAAANLDLAEILRAAGIRLRLWLERVAQQTLFLGFPLPARVGSPASRMHWLAVRLQLSTRLTSRKGFRTNEHNHQRWDAELADSADPLNWIATQNWSEDQLRSRGSAAIALREANILLIGAGALGSAMACMLVRMGVKSLGVIDNDVLKMGNLVRHELMIDSLGSLKAQALAEHCNNLSIHAKVVALPGIFPPSQSVIAAKVRGYDVVIDCTASDDILHAMGHFDWGREKQFLSLSLTWRGKGLLAFYASESAFPSQDAIERFQIAPHPDPDANEASIEGLGCWHPVFPATQADVQLWAAMAVGFLERMIGTRQRACSYFRRNDQGEINVTTCEAHA